MSSLTPNVGASSLQPNVASLGNSGSTKNSRFELLGKIAAIALKAFCALLLLAGTSMFIGGMIAIGGGAAPALVWSGEALFLLGIGLT